MRFFILACAFVSATLSALSASPRLPASFSAEQRTQLGLEASEQPDFGLEELTETRLVLVLFDLYCPVCQKSAENLRQLHVALTEQFPNTPMLAVGSGDTPLEAATFARKFELAMPVTSDRERALASAFDASKTPAVLLLERASTDKPFEVTWSREGYFGHEHLDALLARLGHEQR